MPSFSLKWMLAGVAFVALGCLALLNASLVWAGICYAAAALLLLTAPVCIVYRRGARRAFWVGATVFGWGCVVLAAAGFHSTSIPMLPTTSVLEHIFDNVPKREGVATKLVSTRGGDLARTRVTGPVPIKRDFMRTAQPLFVLLLGLAGGVVGQCVYATRDKNES